MQSKTMVSRLLIAVCCVAMAGVGAPAFMGPSSHVWAADNGGSDAQITSEIQKQLQGKSYRGVTVHVDNGTAMLSGQVDVYAYKSQAVKKAKKVRGVQNVQDNIAVGGASVPDQELQRKLMQKIEVDRVGFGQVFDAIGATVQNGVVTLEGHAVGPVAKQSAIALTEYMPGVKGVIDHISVDPLSPMDNGIRVRAFRAIYGFPALRKYASVPSRPIRISVQNGNITLYGVVDNNMDKQLAYTRARQVQGVFQVTNDLIVANGK